MRKSTILLIVIIAMMSMSISYAETGIIEEQELLLNDDIGDTDVVALCPLYGQHHMKPYGNGYLELDTHEFIWGGSQYVCDCGEILVVKGGHWPGGTIGDFILFHPPYYNLSQYYKVELSWLSYTPYNYINGVMFTN